jgi:hypothetical protein
MQMLSGKQLVVLLTLLLLLLLWFASPSLATTDQEQEIIRNIEVLKNPRASYGEREEPKDRLVKICQPAVPALFQALGYLRDRLAEAHARALISIKS